MICLILYAAYCFICRTGVLILLVLDCYGPWPLTRFSHPIDVHLPLELSFGFYHVKITLGSMVSYRCGCNKVSTSWHCAAEMQLACHTADEPRRCWLRFCGKDDGELELTYLQNFGQYFSLIEPSLSTAMMYSCAEPHANGLRSRLESQIHRAPNWTSVSDPTRNATTSRIAGM